MFDMRKTGERISTLRKKAGMTQMALANKVGISYQAVSNWERGIAMPDIANLKELAEIFSTSVDDILGDEKSADVLLSANNGEVPKTHLRVGEFNDLAPLLPPDKNLVMLEAVCECFNEEEADAAKVNVNFDDDTDELAKKSYEKGNVAMFSLFVNDLSDELRAELCERAFCNGNVVFLSMLVHRLPLETKTEYAKRAFHKGNIAIFGMLRQYLDDDTTKEFRNMAFESGNVALFAALSWRNKEMSVHYEYDGDELEIAEIAYESNDLPTFCELVEHLDRKSLSNIFEKAYKDGKIAFVSEMVDIVSSEDIKNCAMWAYENENLVMFSELVDSMSKQDKKFFKKLAASDKKSNFLAELYV